MMKRAVDSAGYEGIKKLNDLFKDGYEVESIDGNGIYILNKVEMLKAHAINSDMKVDLHLDTSCAVDSLKELSSSIKQVREGINKEDAVKPNSDKRTQRAMKLIDQTAEEFANSSDGLTAVSRDKTNHELEEMINILSNKIDSVDCKASAVNANMSAKQSVLESKVKKYNFAADTATPHIRIEFDDIRDVPKVWVDGRPVDEELTRINVDWNTNTEKIEHKSFDINWLEIVDSDPIRRGVAQNNFTTVGLSKEKSHERN